MRNSNRGCEKIRLTEYQKHLQSAKAIVSAFFVIKNKKPQKKTDFEEVKI